jgi:Predicted nucleic acid-binding protein, contains PIN domain
MKVLDASVLVEYLTDGVHAEASRRHLIPSPGWLWAPHLVDAEVGHALRRGVRAGELSAKAARAALTDLLEMRLQRVSHHLLVERAWELRANVSFYDALYVALAEALEAPLVTLDARLAKAPGVRAEIEVVQAAA